MLSQPGDRDEQEADRIADQIVKMPSPVLQRKSCAPCAAGGPPCPSCKEEKSVVQPKRHAAGENRADASPENFGTGQPLDSGTRLFMESRFGVDFTKVRIHTDADAAASAKAIDSHAFTLGSDIVFGAGEYRPDSLEGRRLLAHELTHVIQQGQTASMEAARPSKSSDSAHLKSSDASHPNHPADPPSEAGARSLLLLLPGGPIFIGPPGLRIQRSAKFINPTPRPENPLTRIANGDTPGLTTPTLNGKVVKNLDDLLGEISPTKVKETGKSGGKVTCQVDPSFAIETSANMIVAENAGAKGWTGTMPVSMLGNPPICSGKAKIPATMNAKPGNPDFVALVRKSEGEHAAELKALHDHYLAPYDKFLTGLSGSGADLNACGQSLVTQLGERHTQAAFAFLLGNQAQVQRFDGPGGTHNDTAVPTFDPKCASVQLLINAPKPPPAGAGPGNVVPVSPKVTKFDPAKLKVDGKEIKNGKSVLKSFSSAANATAALQVIQQYGMTSRNVIGPMEYFLVGDKAPSGAVKGANEMAIDPTLEEVTFGVPDANDWAITQVVGSKIIVLMIFGAQRDEAYSALEVLTRFQFTRLCWVGGRASAPEMQYFRT
ncbi:MAG: DUF4157 domain-containing protein [Nitrospirae bacterium]|nr:DUF4157 domain-containing protein [Candidatus Manganitrophaceae bacterium]